jgi:hypothetical protein
MAEIRRTDPSPIILDPLRPRERVCAKLRVIERGHAVLMRGGDVYVYVFAMYIFAIRSLFPSGNLVIARKLGDVGRS